MVLDHPFVHVPNLNLSRLLISIRPRPWLPDVGSDGRSGRDGGMMTDVFRLAKNVLLANISQT